jgi:autotransporter-associated beta strand protein
MRIMSSQIEHPVLPIACTQPVQQGIDATGLTDSDAFGTVSISGICAIFVMLAMAFASPTWAAGFTDDHESADTYSGWTSQGSRGWTEGSGKVVPQVNVGTTGQLVNNYACANDGTYTVNMTVDQWNGYEGGILLRWSSTSSFYFLKFRPDNLGSGRIYWEEDAITNGGAGTLLASTANMPTTFTVKVVVSGTTFDIYIDNVFVVSKTDDSHASGKVGYAYSIDWNGIYASWNSSSWTDATPATTKYTWTGTTSSDWGTSTNWSPNGVPGATDTIVVDKSGGATIALNGNRSVKEVVLGNATSNAMTIQTGSSGTLTIASGGAISTHASSTGTHVISCPVAMSANMTATVSNASGTVDIQGVLSGGYALTKSGSGALKLSGTNTYSGTTTISAGTIKVGNTAALGGTGSGTNVSSGATLDLNGFAIGAEVVDIAGTGVGGNGAIVNTGADMQAGLRYLTMSADASIGGSNRFDLRWLSGGFTEYFNANNHVLTKVGSGQVTFQALTVQNFNGIVVAGGTFGAEVNAPFASGGAGFTLQPGTTLFLYQTTGNTAPISMNNATLWANNGVMNWQGTISLAGANTIQVDGTSLTLSGVISGTGSLTKTGANPLILSAANTYSGATNISAGTLKLGVANAIPSGSAVTVTGTLDMAGYSDAIGSLAGAGTVDNSSGSGTYTLTTGADNTSTTFSGIIKNTSGNVALSKGGSGALTLSGNNTFSGGYTHVAGDVELGHSNALGAGTATTTSSGRIFLKNGVSIGNTLTISTCNAGVGHSVVNSDTGANATWSGTINVNALCTTGGHLGGAEDQTGSLTLTGPVNMGGTATWVQQRDGIVIYGGGGNATRFDLLKGTARLGATNGLPSNARFSQSHAGYVSALDLYGYSQTFQGIAAPANSNTTLTNSQVGLSTLTLTGSVDTTYSGNIAGNLALVKSGTYVQTLGGTNTYTGATTISQGTLKMGGASALSSATTLSVTGTLDLNGYSESVGSITGAGTIDNTSSNAGTYTLTTGGDNTSTTFSGTIKNTAQSVALTKTGSGTLTLSGTNTFTGATTVSNGTLLVNGTNANSTVTVNSGAILGGTGSVGPIVGNSGTVRPGSSVAKGILGGTTGNFSGGTSSKLSVRAAAFTTAGTDFDRLNLSGALTLGGSSELDLDMTGIASAGTVSGVVLASSISGTFGSVVPSNYAGSLGFNVVYGGTSINLVVNNQAPGFTKGADQTVAEDAGAQTVAGWATSIDKGSAYESGQTVSFVATNNNNSLFSVQPSISSTGVLTYTPAANANGSATVTVRIRDNGGTTNSGVDSSAAQTFAITVSSVNDASTFTSSGVTTGTENAVYTYSITTSDVDGNARTITAPTKPAWLTITDNGDGTATLTGTPLHANTGANSVTIRVNDGTVNTDQTFTITVADVNNASAFTSSGVTTGTENSAYTYNITTSDADGDSRTITAPTKPTWLTLTDNGNGTATLTGTPLHANTGVNNVTIRVNDGTVNTDQTFTITVADVNNASAFTSSGVTTGTENAVYTYNITTSDADGDARTITAPTKPAWLSITDNGNGTATLTGTPLNANTGANSVVLRVNDGTVNTDQSFTITVADVNNAPAFTSSGVTTGTENAVYTYNITTSDADGDARTITAPTKPTWLTITDNGNGTASLSGTPLNANTGANSVTIRVNDGTVNTDQSFTITVADVNNASAFTSSGVTTGTENVAYTYNITTSDADGDARTITAPTKPAWLSITDNGNGTATLSGTPLHANTGANSVVLRINDGTVTTDQSFTITVADVNNASAFTSSGVTTGTENVAYTYNITTSDADGDARTITAPTKPAWLSITDNGNGTATLTGTPLNANAGANSVTIRVNDGTVNTDQSFTITVTDVNNAPAFTSSGVTTGTENVAYTYNITTSDADGDARTITAPTKPAWLSITDNGNGTATLTGTPLHANAGANSVTIRVNDGTVNTDQSFTITVADVNNAPAFTSSA